MQVRFTTDLDPIGTAHDTSPVPSPFADRASFQRARAGFEAFALGPGRVFLAVSELNRVTRAWRAVAGQPLERIDLSSMGDVTDIVNARELGDTLMIVGTTLAHEPPTPNKAQPFPEPVPFVTLVSPSGVVVTKLARSATTGENTVLGTVDLARGRFGLAVYEPLPTWDGGATYVVPLRADSTPSGAFEALGPAPTEIAQPLKACASTSPGWERGDTQRTRSLILSTPSVLTMRGSGATIRERLTPGGVCFDRFTLLATNGAAQLDPASGEVTWLETSIDGKTATKRRFSCSDLRWE
jgi:hypothetical protein